MKQTCAWRFGSNRSRQPTCWPCVWMIPAHTILSGFGSIPSNNCTPKPSNLFFADGISSGCCALNTFCARCCSLEWIENRLNKFSSICEAFLNNWYFGCLDTYPPKFFHLAKNDSLFISVGSKNLLIVRGILRFIFCCTPLYLNDISSDGASNGRQRNFTHLKSL